MNATEALTAAWAIHGRGDVAAAVATYRDVAQRQPGRPDAWIYLGIGLFDQRQFAASADAYRRAIAVGGDDPIAWNNLGNSLRMLGEVEPADECFDRAIGLKPDYLSPYKNRGTLWVWSGQIDRGLQWYDRGLQIAPRDAETHRNIGVIELLRGNMPRGWDEYRWRWAMPGLGRPRTLTYMPSATAWRGQPLAGRRVVIYPEQGLGDAIHFIRIAAVLAGEGAHVTLVVESDMAAILLTAPGVSDVLLVGQIPPPERYDFHGSLIEWFDWFYQRDAKLPSAPTAGDHYLTSRPDRLNHWRRWLDSNTKGNRPRIGINWQGSVEHHADVYRSMPLEQLRPLIDGLDATFVSMQFGAGSEQLNADWTGPIFRLPGGIDRDGKFLDTAAIVQSLDAVVTTDTSLAHLAGALNVPTHVMLGKVPDWRWGLDGCTTHWYPSMTLHRQEELGRWEPVIESLIDAVV